MIKIQVGDILLLKYIFNQLLEINDLKRISLIGDVFQIHVKEVKIMKISTVKVKDVKTIEPQQKGKEKLSVAA